MISTQRFVHSSKTAVVTNKKQKKPKYNKNKFIAAFIVAMALFACIRHGFNLDIPLRSQESRTHAAREEWKTEEVLVVENEYEDEYEEEQTALLEETTDTTDSTLQQHNGHRVIGVHSWTEAFPDIQDTQIVAAQKNGISPCRNREEAMRLVKRNKLVNITNSPFYIVDDLTHSMPYLVPKAQQLLNTICLNFIDSLQVKGMQPHLPMITSVLRTTEDVSKLQRRNRNATENSCHCYGTTVDITYNRFVPITGNYDPQADLTRWSLPYKQVMAEVLRDLRAQGVCYVKYEYKQACFHLTVR